MYIMFRSRLARPQSCTESVFAASEFYRLPGAKFLVGVDICQPVLKAVLFY
jgi:hypothetical protein